MLRGAFVVDGTGASGRHADVLVSGDRVVAIEAAGAIPEVGSRPEVDLAGLVLSPGFIDPHTHYDAQVFWDADLTPSSWHGVTTVVVGNCGFGVAPTRPEHREVMLETLERVEGMPLDALRQGFRWGFESYAEYLELVDRLPKRLNIASLVGHTPIRHYILGEAATERAATDDEIRSMQRIVEEAMAAGAVGLSTSKSPTHRGAGNKPVPTRAATIAELEALASVLRASDAGVVQATYGPELFVDQFAALSQRTGRPVTWAALLADRADPGRAPAIVERTVALGGEVYPQIACRPVVFQWRLDDPASLSGLPAFKEVRALPDAERLARYGDRRWQARARDDISRSSLWSGRFDTAVVEESPTHDDLIGGPTLGRLARERGTDAFALAVELSLADGLHTRFRVLLANDDEDQVAHLLQDKRLLLGLSDAGAHTSQLCDANAPTYLLGHWHRARRALSLEDAVWRLTGQPAAVFGLRDRGVIRPGAVADLVAFDAATVGTGPLVRVRDLPGGADRLVAHSTGIRHVWVAGELVRTDGADIAEVAPGRLLRNGTSR